MPGPPEGWYRLPSGHIRIREWVLLRIQGEVPDAGGMTRVERLILRGILKVLFHILHPYDPNRLNVHHTLEIHQLINDIDEEMARHRGGEGGG